MRNRNERYLRVESLEERTLLAVWSGTEIEFPHAIPAKADNGAVDLSSVGKTGETIWTVNSLSDSVTWDTADSEITLREAAARASKGDKIVFDAALSGGTITLCGSQLEIREGITIDASSIGGITIDANQSSRCFYVFVGTNEFPVELINLTITGGKLSDNYAYGGGIYCSFSILTLTNCTIAENSVSGDYSHGGGIYIYGTLTLSNCTIGRNSAYYGGGIYHGGGTITFTNSTISENTAYHGGGIYNNDSIGILTLSNCVIEGNTAYHGGGIYNNDSGTLTLTNSTISENTADNGGGGIYVHSNTTVTLADCTIAGNTVSGDYSHGGGICSYGTVTLAGCTIAENTVSGDCSQGGGIYFSFSTAALTNCTITKNSAKSGGGIHNDSGTFTLMNCSITGNSAEYGGGIRNNFCFHTSTLTNCTIAGNSAEYGGGIYNYNYSTLSLILTNCIIAGNSAEYGGGIYNSYYSTITLTNCTLAGNSAYYGGGIYNYDRASAKLYNTIVLLNTASSESRDVYNYRSSPISACNTISTFTGWTESESVYTYDPAKPLFIDPENGDYQLAENSQAVDKGNNTYVTTETDLAGNPRIAGSIVDLGAYEYCAKDLHNITDVTIKGWNGVYDGVPHSITIIDPHESTDTFFFTCGGQTYTAAPSFTEAGVYSVTVTVSRIGHYDWTSTVLITIKQLYLSAPDILTGTKGHFVSGGNNRHFIEWNSISDAAGYELAYSADGENWKTVTTADTSTLVTGLTYGTDIQYKVRAFMNSVTSGWSPVKIFNVCPVDINGDGEIASADRALLSSCWLSSLGDENFILACDIDGDGEIASADRYYLSSNWLCEAGDEDLIYPKPKTADAAMAEYVSEFGIDLNVF